ncbi:MAG: NAD(P)H-binding protein, partial [Pseudolabrys sp.]
MRALVRREDERAEALRRLGAEVVEGDLTDLASMHRAIEGCRRIYFGMSVTPAYLEATVNTAAVARHHGVEAFVTTSQMTVSQMSISETTDSPQHKLHWLSEQALSWSGLPVVTVRPTVFLEGFFLHLAAPGVRASDELALPMDKSTISQGRNRPIWTTMRASSQLGRPIRYRDVPLPAWSESLRQARFPEHVVHHLSAMAELTRQG